MSRFKNRVAIVTGAAQGIGWAIAQALAQQEACVAMLDIHASLLMAQAQALQAQGLVVQAWPVDVRCADGVRQALDRVFERWGQVDILVNVAGVLHAKTALETAEDEWAQTFDVNVFGVFLVSKAVAARMIPRRQGVIITVGSNAASTPRMNMAAYAASKAASAQFTRCLGLELAQHGIRCNIVSPGSTDTPMQRALWSEPQDADKVIQGNLIQHRLGIPLRRIAEPQDIAHAVCFLASDDARHITLHDLRVDGGATLGA